MLVGCGEKPATAAATLLLSSGQDFLPAPFSPPASLFSSQQVGQPSSLQRSQEPGLILQRCCCEPFWIADLIAKCTSWQVDVLRCRAQKWLLISTSAACRGAQQFCCQQRLASATGSSDEKRSARLKLELYTCCECCSLSELLWHTQIEGGDLQAVPPGASTGCIGHTLLSQPQSFDKLQAADSVATSAASVLRKATAKFTSRSDGLKDAEAKLAALRARNPAASAQEPQ